MHLRHPSNLKNHPELSLGALHLADGDGGQRPLLQGRLSLGTHTWQLVVGIDTWQVAHDGTWHLALGMWNLALGTWHFALGELGDGNWNLGIR